MTLIAIKAYTNIWHYPLPPK
ncbi:hypothetical protein PFDG_05472 [Plasmodium falciparum Dd2]|uniref:Uncharacterized protein n=1 Tax=Plasmodium falciparum (isolate Dd2) TaxID=57267 RepID=A0A0L7M0X6_PLAF4|nr:hypothetical protein PFDG_05472 [Plasmodium falciparum Dd2]